MKTQFLHLLKVLISLDSNRSILSESDIEGFIKVSHGIEEVESNIIRMVNVLKQNNYIKQDIQKYIEIYWHLDKYINYLYYIHGIVVKLIRGYDKRILPSKQSGNQQNDINFIPNLLILIQSLQNLHTTMQMNMISDSEFKEEKENIQDFIEVEQRLTIFINELEIVQQVDQVVSALIYVYLETMNCIWHIEQINEIIKKILSHIDPAINLESPYDAIKH